MFDLKLDEDTHDIIYEDGDFQLTPTESQSLAQKLRIKLLTFMGEWYLNEEEGIPYYQSIFGKNRAKETIDNIFKVAILEEPDVISLMEFRSSIDVKRRVYRMDFKVRSENDDEPIPITIEL